MTTIKKIAKQSGERGKQAREIIRENKKADNKKTFLVSFYDQRRKSTKVEAGSIQEAIEIVMTTITKSGFAVKSAAISIAVVKQK